MTTRPEFDRISDETASKLQQISIATISAQLRKHGFLEMYLEDTGPLRPELRMVGQAFTLRYIPTRPDLDPTGEFDNTTNKQRIAVESVEPGDVLVIDARGDTRAGSLGNILATRIKQRGAAGIVTDGALRDTPAFASIDLPVYARAPHPNLSTTIHYAVDINVPISCAGISVIPGDVLVGDAEGVIVIPLHLADQIATDGLEQEEREAFILNKIESGSTILGVYPPNEATLAEYDAWKKHQR